MGSVRKADAAAVIFSPIVKVGENAKKASAAVAIFNPIARTLARAEAAVAPKRRTDFVALTVTGIFRLKFQRTGVGF